MSYRGKATKFALAAALITTAIAMVSAINPPCAYAELTSGAIEKLVKEADVFGADDKFTVGISGQEVTVSTYVSSATKDIANDAKINAVLLAQKIMEGDSAISRVTTRFYEPRAAASYYEVSVTVGDIKAFASGVIKKEQLLASLKLNHVSSQSASRPEDTSREKYKDDIRTALATQGPDKGSGEGDVKGRPAKGDVDALALLDKQTKQYQGYGLTFKYPVSFRYRSSDGENRYVVAQFENEMTGHHDITMELQLLTEGKTVQEWAQQLMVHHSTFQGYQRVQAPAIVTFGPQKISASNEAFAYRRHRHWRSSDDAAANHYERDIYFGWPGRVFNIKVYCHSEDYNKAMTAFNTVLSSLRVDGVAKAAHR